MSDLSRRAFLTRSSALGLGFAGLGSLWPARTARASLARSGPSRFGALIADPAKILDLPEGFTYSILSKAGATMDDGWMVPGLHDGMAAFAAPPTPDGLTILIRNHEIEHAHKAIGPWGERDARFAEFDRSLAYDPGYGRHPNRGGTTTLVYDTKAKKLVRHFLSLAGTMRNCAGGPMPPTKAMPHGAWISCEETDQTADSDTFEKSHGYAFIVPATTEASLARPDPVRAMGRFYREAVAVHPRTGIVYQSEDQMDGLLYRYIPKDRDDLHAGGRLEALVIVDKPGIDTSNNIDPLISPRTPMRVAWIALDDPEAVGSSLRSRGRRDGAAIFARTEGMWATPDAIYFACTEGGTTSTGKHSDGSPLTALGPGKGQLWKYTPGAHEGDPHEHEVGAEEGGTLELICEPNDSSVMDHPDNITVAPWGDLIVCEDGEAEQFLLGVTPPTPSGPAEVYKFARNAHNTSEFAGACFSPDGTTLFVNIQNPGYTLAITGPWHRPT